MPLIFFFSYYILNEISIDLINATKTAVRSNALHLVIPSEPYPSEIPSYQFCWFLHFKLFSFVMSKASNSALFEK